MSNEPDEEEMHFLRNNEEMFLLCMLAGCETTIVNDSADKCHIETQHPCGIYHDGKEWVVVEAANLH